MHYEIDFIGIDEESKDADAIAFRYILDDGTEKIGVYDGGFQKHGEALEKHINTYYLSSYSGHPKNIDFVICSHSDSDHVSGLKNIFNDFEVSVLYMNRPWLYIDEIFDKVKDSRITPESLEERLKNSYKDIAELEKIANMKGVTILEAFQGEKIDEYLTILSPTKELYIDMLIKSNKTPLEENFTGALESFFGKVRDYIKTLIEDWHSENLREDVETSAENEMSVVILGDMVEECFLLTGDVGIRGLDLGITYSEKIGIPLINRVNFIQIPHHGGRHNISPSILNRMIGKIVEEDTFINKTAFVSVGKNSSHPLRMVTNAFIRRGVKVYKTDGQTIRHYSGMPPRPGWSSLTRLSFETKVEEWTD